MVGEQGALKHNAAAQEWLEFPGCPTGIEQYFDIRNSQAVWLELTNLIMGAEADLALALAYKALEPSQEPPFGDDLAINDLYYIHNRKMTLLNQSVQDVVRVQDLVNRLLHEVSAEISSIPVTRIWEKSPPHPRERQKATGNKTHHWAQFRRRISTPSPRPSQFPTANSERI